MQINDALTRSLLWWNGTNIEGQDDSDGSSPWWVDSDSNSSDNDIFALSPEFSAIRQEFVRLSEQITVKATIEEVQNKAANLTSEFGPELLDALDEADIDIGDETLNLTMDSNGFVRVFGSNPNKEAIETFFMKNPDWSERYADCHLMNEMSHKLELLGTMQSSSSNPYLKAKSSTWDSTVVSIEPEEGVTSVQFL